MKRFLNKIENLPEFEHKNSILKYGKAAMDSNNHQNIKKYLADTAMGNIPNEVKSTVLDTMRRMFECDHLWNNPKIYFQNEIKEYRCKRINQILKDEILYPEHPKYNDAITWLINFDSMDDDHIGKVFAAELTEGNTPNQTITKFLKMQSLYDQHYRIAKPNGNEILINDINQLKDIIQI